MARGARRAKLPRPGRPPPRARGLVRGLGMDAGRDPGHPGDRRPHPGHPPSAGERERQRSGGRDRYIQRLRVRQRKGDQSGALPQPRGRARGGGSHNKHRGEKMSRFEDPVIITCSISGTVANRDQCPAIPYTPEEYAAEARRIVDEGGSMIHIHARTPDGTPSYEIEDFRNITDAILNEVDDVIINYSTGAV